MQFRGVALFVIIGMATGLGACGYEAIGTEGEFEDFAQEECGEGDCDEVEAVGTQPPDGEGETRRYSASGESDDSGGDEPIDDGNSSDVPDDSEPDLNCADDAAICRFCGPVTVDVVTECPDGDDRFECQVFELVNQQRIDHGLQKLEYNGALAESGMVHAMDLSLCDYFAHDSLDGTTFFERCAASDYGGTCTGENIGGGQSSPQDVMDAWMASPGHRDNILYEHHTEVGVAYYEGDGNYGEYWLKHFGRE